MELKKIEVIKAYEEKLSEVFNFIKLGTVKIVSKTRNHYVNFYSSNKEKFFDFLFNFDIDFNVSYMHFISKNTEGGKRNDLETIYLKNRRKLNKVMKDSPTINFSLLHRVDFVLGRYDNEITTFLSTTLFFLGEEHLNLIKNSKDSFVRIKAAKYEYELVGENEKTLEVSPIIFFGETSYKVSVLI